MVAQIQALPCPIDENEVHPGGFVPRCNQPHLNTEGRYASWLLGSQGLGSVTLVGRVERRGECASPLYEAVDVEMQRRAPGQHILSPCVSCRLSLHPRTLRRHRQQGMATSLHPITLLGLGESWNGDTFQGQKGRELGEGSVSLLSLQSSPRDSEAL